MDTARARRLFELGRGGFRDIVAAATGTAPPAPEGTPDPPASARPLDFDACALEGGGWSVILSGVERSARFRVPGASAPPLLNPLGLLEAPKPVEPRPLGLSARDLERLEASGTFALEGEPGTCKLTFRLEAPGDGAEAVAFRVEDGEGVPLGWLAAGPELPAATFPVEIPKTERRPMTVRLLRLDPATGEELPWSARGIVRAWGSHQGPGLWKGHAFEKDGRAVIRERRGRPLGGGSLEMAQEWSLANGSSALRVAFEWDRAGDKPWPPLALGAGGCSALEVLEEDELRAPELAEALGTDPALGLRLVPRSVPGRPSTSKALVWLSDREFEWVAPEGAPSAAIVRPASGLTRFALVPPSA